MLIAYEDLDTRDILKYPHRAIVVWNTDPLGLGRVKVIIPGLLEGVIKNLPWVSRWNAAGLGTEILPPQIDDEVMVEFKMGDIYHPFYTGQVASVANTSGETRSMGNAQSIESDGYGNKKVTNAATGEKTETHQSGSSVTFENDGSMIIEAQKKLTLKTKSGVGFIIDGESGEITKLEPASESQGGSKSSLEEGPFSATVDNFLLRSTGGYESNVDGGYKVKSGGSYSMSITGNLAEVIAGQTTRLHAQLVNESYGLGKNMQVVTGAYSTSILAGTYSVSVAAGAITMQGLTVSITAATNLSLNAPFVSLGLGLAPMVSVLSDPIEDFITGKVKLGLLNIKGG